MGSEDPLIAVDLLPRTLPRHAIVTGGNGYVGSRLIRMLVDRGVEVHAVANAHADRLGRLLPQCNIHPIAHDFAAVAALVTRLQPEAIFHLAAVHAEPPTFDEMMGMLECSLLLGVALLHGAATCPHPPVFVHAGTYWQFEGDVYAPNTFYAAAKQALHDLLAYYRRVTRLPSMTLVLYDIFGPDDTRPKLWSKLLEAPPGSTFPTTEGRQKIELVHVDDVARAFLQAAALLLEGTPTREFYAVRSAQRLTLRSMLEQVRDRAGLNLHFDWGAVPYWPGQIFEPWEGPCLPGWQPAVDPVDGVISLIQAGLRLNTGR